ncbi:MAG: phosphate ABC transporter, permease protein PstA, partial [Cellulomonadaceae bacterium]|nr:phosphate ABC transporter, permease protein PstA [Cellulomonadaceae bacterium]
MTAGTALTPPVVVGGSAEPAAETHRAPATWVRELEDLAPSAPAPRKRVVGTATATDRFIVTGSLLAAASLAWVVCFRLLPWAAVPGYVVTAFVLFLVIVTVATSVTSDGPMIADRLASAVVTGGAALVGVALVSTVVYTFVRGAPALPHLTMFISDMAGVGPRDPLTRGGVAHAIVGSLIQISIAVAVTVPLGFGTAVFMTEVGGGLARIVRTVVEAMTALPSIVAGLFIYTVLIVGLGVPRSGLAAAAALSVMMLPIIARAADVVLRVIPSGLREIGRAS